MPTTENLGLSSTSISEMETLSFLNWRLSQMGSSSSNSIILNNWASEVSGSILSLGTSRVPYYIVEGTKISLGVYDASGSSAGGLSSPNHNDLIILSLDYTEISTDALYLSFEGGTPEELLKYSRDLETTVSLDKYDLLKNRKYLFIYDSDIGGWVWIKIASPSMVDIPGDDGDILVISNHLMTSSGSNINDVVGIIDDLKASTFITYLDNNPNFWSFVLSGSPTGVSPKITHSYSASQIELSIPNKSITGTMFEAEAVKNINCKDASIYTDSILDGSISRLNISTIERSFTANVMAIQSGILDVSGFGNYGYLSEATNNEIVYGYFVVPSDFISGLKIKIALRSRDSIGPTNYRNVYYDISSGSVGARIDDVITTGSFKMSPSGTIGTYEWGAEPVDGIDIETINPGDIVKLSFWKVYNVNDFDIWYSNFIVSYLAES